MFTSSNNKSPLINCERKQPKNQKPQNPLSTKITPKMHEKCMKYVNKKKKKG